MEFYREMEEEDLLDNEKVKVRALYGERENALVKVLEGQFALLEGSSGNYWIWILIILLLLLIIWKRRKKKGEIKGVAPVKPSIAPTVTNKPALTASSTVHKPAQTSNAPATTAPNHAHKPAVHTSQHAQQNTSKPQTPSTTHKPDQHPVHNPVKK